MIFTKLAERYISTPYKRYSVIVTCNVLRRLTVIEWTILHVVGEFGRHPKYQKQNLSFFLENILGISTSEPLVRPCIESLLKNKYLEMPNFNLFTEYSKIPLSSISLTSVGVEILKRGYVPGTTKAFSETIYHDLLEEKSFDYKPTDYGSQPNTIPVVEQIDIDFDFPSESIISAINTGLLFKSKYRDANSEAIEVKCNADNNEWRTEKLILSIESDGTITYNLPNIPTVATLANRMLNFPFANRFSSHIIDISRGLPDAIIIGNNISIQLGFWLKSMDIAFLDIKMYQCLESAHVAIGSNTLFILNASAFSIQKEGNQILVYLPISFPDDDAVLAWKTGSYQKMGILQGNLNGNLQNISVAYRSSESISWPDLLKESISAGELSGEPYSELLCQFPVFELSDSEFRRLSTQHIQSVASIENKIFYLKKLDETYKNVFGNSLPSDFVTEKLATACNQSSLQQYYDDVLLCHKEFFSHGKYRNYESFVILCTKLYPVSSLYDFEFLLSAICVWDVVEYKEFVQHANEGLTKKIKPQMLDAIYSESLSENSCPFSTPILSYSVTFNQFVSSLGFLRREFASVSICNEEISDEVLAGIPSSDFESIENSTQQILEAIKVASQCGATIFSSGNEGALLKQNAESILSYIARESEGTHTYLVDTCAFLHTPGILSLFDSSDVVRIPFTVLRELDYHKDHHPDLTIKKKAAFACKCIEQAVNYSSSNDHVTVYIEPHDYPELLPVGFSDTKHDDLILSVAFNYKSEKPTILSDDTNFRNIARSQGFTVLPWKEFVEAHGEAAIRTTDVSNNQNGISATAISATSITSQIDSYLARSTETLTLSPYYLPKKKAKALSQLGYDTLQKLYDASPVDINQKIKSTSMRDVAIRMQSKLRAEIDKLNVSNTRTVQ